jgi:hypothetical protein
MIIDLYMIGIELMKQVKKEKGNVSTRSMAQNINKAIEVKRQY